MATRVNPYYSDPQLSKGLDNIASLFAPPSATETYAYAKAASDRATEARRAAASRRIQAGRATVGDYIDAGVSDPAKQFGIADMYARAAGGAQPQALDSLSYAVNGNANNTFAGQNAKLRSDERNKDVEEATKVKVAALSPVQNGAVRIVPPSAAPLLGVDPSNPAALYQYGPTDLQPGVKQVRPDGTELQGNAPARTLDQAKAEELAGLRKNNVIDDRTMAGIIFGTTPLQSVQTPNGNRFVTGPEAIGQTPAPDASKQSELATLQNERSTILRQNPNDPRIKEYDSRIAALGRGQQQGAYDKAMDESFAAENTKIYENAKNAAAQRGTISYLRDLFSNPATAQGFSAEAQLGAKKAMSALGISVGDMSDAEVARALSNKMALVAKNDGGENTMPGSLSDGDRTFLQLMSTNLGNSREANLKMLDYYDRVQQRQQQVNDMRQAYVERNGRLDEGFRRELADFTKNNPLFADQPGYKQAQGQPSAAVPAPAPAAGEPGAPSVPVSGAQSARLKFNPATGAIE